MNPIVSRWLKRVILGGLAAIAALTALAYGIDYGIFRVRVATNRQPFASMTVLTYYAVPQKSGKTEFIFNPPKTGLTEVCPQPGDDGETRVKQQGAPPRMSLPRWRRWMQR